VPKIRPFDDFSIGEDDFGSVLHLHHAQTAVAGRLMKYPG
jgi:hypothetical protein